MEAIVVRALSKIASDCHHKKQGALKKQCNDTLGTIKENQDRRGEGDVAEETANMYLPVLLAACSSNVSKLVTTALDSLVKLIDYGYIQDVEVDSDDEEDDRETPTQGRTSASQPASSANRLRGNAEVDADKPDGEAEPPSPTSNLRHADMSVSVAADGAPARWTPPRMLMDEVVEKICDCDLETEDVQLQVIKALVHACTANTLAVHQASLLTAVKTIYTVHLSTHDPVNKNTAKASLQQMLSVVFARMEAKDKELKEEAAAKAKLEALRASDPDKYPPPPPESPEPEPQPEPEPDPVFIVPTTLYESVAESLGLLDLYATVPEVSREERKSRNRRYRRALREYRRRQWEATAPQPFPSVEHEDAFLLFRALCKLSQRPDHSGQGDGMNVAPTAEESRQLENKAVSLELLLSIVESSGPGFKTAEKFVLAVRHYLCEALLLNSTSSNRTVMQLSLRIFKPMCRDFKTHLKSQIEVFITTVFLRVLESENSTFEHKRQVLDVVMAFSETPQALVEIFLNYDCDLHAIDLYNRIVNALSKISKGRGMSNADITNNPGLLREESYLRRKGLEGLVLILDNLLRCVGSDINAELRSQNEQLLDGGGGDSPKANTDSTSELSRLGSNGHLSRSRSSVGDHTGESIDRKSPTAVVQEYDRKKKLAGDLENGFIRFNLSPSKGIAYLAEKRMLVYEPRAVATFLLENCDKLDKTMIGEYLGKEVQYKDGFCVQVLHEYVDMMDFQGMRFDDAIRHYLSGFRLPGEAQKIDRMMEKFAERYCLQNPTVFPSADTAFILAFSIIMLNTDLHNPAIKEERKMTREGFCANNRGIAAGGNLEESFLNEIFDHIRANPISLKEDDTARERVEAVQGSAASFPLYFTGASSQRQKREAFNKEREGIIKDTEALFRLRKKQASAAKAQALARARAEANKNEVFKAPGSEHSTPPVPSTEAVERGEAKLEGAPPPNVSAALRADSVLEGRRDVVRAMFEVAWWPMLGAFSQVLEDVDHPDRAETITEAQEGIERDMIALCLEGCRAGIRLGGLCDRWSGGEGEGGIARETFVNSLAKFTLLDTVKEMRLKNIDCIRTLLDIALEDGNFLADSWGSVLRYISQLARLQLFASGLHTDDHFFTSEDDALASVGTGTSVHSTVTSVASVTGSSVHGASGRRGTVDGIPVTKKPTKGGGLFGRVNASEQARSVERMNAQAVSMAIDPATIDRVFSNSANLSTDAVKHFVTQLCAVSSQEVNHAAAATFRSKDILRDMSQPRVFSLQKLVEVADFNMDTRGRIVWANVWGVLSEHFSALGAHNNRYVAEYAVDSLKQLGLKFMFKEELRDFNFQRLFLNPFENIFVATYHQDIKVLVLDCVQNLIQARSSFIRSGWKSIFSVLSLAARDTSNGSALARQAWQVVARLVDEDMSSLVYDFLDVTKCLLAFVESPDEDLSLRGLKKLRVCADYLAQGDLHILPPGLHGHISSRHAATAEAIASANDGGSVGHELMYLQLWWPLLFGLSEAMGDPRPRIRASALEVLANVLETHGEIFSAQTWGLLFRGVINPVFENAITDPTPPLSSEWPGQEDDPRDVAARDAAAYEEEMAKMEAERTAREEERAARKSGVGGTWGRLSSPFSGLRAGGPTRASSPRHVASNASQEMSPRPVFRPQEGWTTTMAEPLLDVCFSTFFKYGDATLPLLPDILLLHQRCICQESEVLARIALRSLGRFVTSMHRVFPDGSATVVRRQPSAEDSDGEGSGAAKQDDKEEVYTVRDCLTASLCAIMADNLPVELLNNPVHVTQEAGAQMPDATTTSGHMGAGQTFSSPMWMEQKVIDPPARSGMPSDINVRPESESSWGELQDANAQRREDVDESESSGSSKDSEDSESSEEAKDYDDRYNNGSSVGYRGVNAMHRGFNNEDHAVGGDVVMVSAHGNESEDANGGVTGTMDEATGDSGSMGRRPNLSALMTMLVVSLRMQRLVHWVIRKRCLDGLSERNLMELLSALEAASITALQFNRNHNLRRALGQVGFMTRGQPVPLCPMLEQEVAGYNLLLRTLVVLSCGMDVDTGEAVEGGAWWPFAQERLMRACKCVILAYADREEHSTGLELSMPGLDHSALVEEVKETTALAILALRSMMHISADQVQKNLEWMYGSMVRLVRCDSDAVRHEVHEILTKKMGPRMMTTG